MPQRCSPARVRFAAPKTGAPLPAARRCGDLESTTGGSGGITRWAGYIGLSADRPKKWAGYIGLSADRPKKWNE
jgi:hypothetical protein